MARVPQHPLPGKTVVVKTTMTVGEQKTFLADFDRQLAVLDAKKSDTKGNYSS